MKDLRKRREAAGLSQEELAGYARISARTVYMIEAGLSDPHRATVASIEAALEKAEEE